MTKTYYEIFKDHEELRRSYKHDVLYVSTSDVLDEYYTGDSDARLVSRFETLDEAKAAFEDEKKICSTGLYRGTTGWLIEADVVVLQKNDYDTDEDGDECLDQGEDLDAYAEPYSVGYLYEDDARKIVEAGQYKAAEALMDDEIREDLHRLLVPCDDVTFLSIYMDRHESKYREDFVVG